MHLLTKANPKTEKGEEYGYRTYILHLSPSNASGVMNTCPHATKTCPDWCLNTAGRGAMQRVQNARIRKTVLFKEDREMFLALLYADIYVAKREAEQDGMKLAVRLNGTSDLPWETIYPELFTKFWDITFYDFTKWPLSRRKADPVPNYHLVQSYTGYNFKECIKTLEQGGNVAVMYSGDKLPPNFGGFPIIDGDEHDLRFLDKPGEVAALKVKGRARKVTSDPAIIKT